MDELVNVDAAASLLRLSRNTVYALARSGRLASYRVGHKLRFSPADIDAYLKSTRQTGRDGAFAHEASGAGVSAGSGVDAGAGAVAAGGGAAHTARADGAGDGFSSTQDGTDAHYGDGAAMSTGCDALAASLAHLAGLDDPAVRLLGDDASMGALSQALNAQGCGVVTETVPAYAALVQLYIRGFYGSGPVHAAVANLYDGRTNSYNLSAVRALLPGQSVIVMRLYSHMTGYAVAAGNPKRLTTWGALLRDDVRIATPRKGTGARVLLDEKLRALEARSWTVGGYEDAGVSVGDGLVRVADGRADAAICSERAAAVNKSLQFIALQKESVDLVVCKTQKSATAIRDLKRILAEQTFREMLQALTQGDVLQAGAILYES